MNNLLPTYCDSLRQRRVSRRRSALDFAPKFYPLLGSLVPADLPGWAVGAMGAGAEPSA
jgi:hypothetical protein